MNVGYEITHRVLPLVVYDKFALTVLIKIKFGYLGRQSETTYLVGRSRKECSPEELVGLAHGCLDVDALEVLPALLEEGGEEVDTHEDVLSNLVLAHLLVTDGD